jgi:hypothetical protein
MYRDRPIVGRCLKQEAWPALPLLLRTAVFVRDTIAAIAADIAIPALSLGPPGYGGYPDEGEPPRCHDPPKQSGCFYWLTRMVSSPLLGEPLKYTRPPMPLLLAGLIRPARYSQRLAREFAPVTLRTRSHFGPGYTWEMTHFSRHLLVGVAIHHPDAQLTGPASLNIQVSDRPVHWRRPDRSVSRTRPDILPVQNELLT